jgi:hypothetical protein
MTEKMKEIFRLACHSYKHGGGTPVVIGDRIFVSFPDDKTGEYEHYHKDTITILHCGEITENCLDKDENGDLQYFGDVEKEYAITLRPIGGPAFYDEYHPFELVEIKAL